MNRERQFWFYDVLFLLVFVLAGYLRLTGLNWGEGAGQHPDENHFSGVLQVISAQKCSIPAIPVTICPPDQRRWISLGEYFSSKSSPLNPYSRGAGSYVYGNLPMTIVRIAADATNETNLKEFARQFSGLADLFAIFFLYLLVSRLYGRRVGLLASLFSALTVMQIQQSHFFTVDLFVNMFALLALYFAVAILEEKEKGAENRALSKEDDEYFPASEQELEAPPSRLTSLEPLIADLKFLLRNRSFLLSIGFGVALGMAMASKINIAPLAIVLPAAFFLRFLIQKKGTR